MKLDSPRYARRLRCAAFLLPMLFSAMAGAQDWAVRHGSSGSAESIFASATDAAGNIFVGGNFDGTVTFGNGTGAANLTAIGRRDLFLAKFNPTGGFVWARQAGGPLTSAVTGIAVDPLGDVFITGTFSDDITFKDAGGDIAIPSDVGQNVFLAKYDAAGNLQWAQEPTFEGEQIYSPLRLPDVAVDSAGNAVLHASRGKAILIKFDGNGVPLWTRSGGSGGNDVNGGIAIDGTDHILICGLLQYGLVDSATFGTGANQQTRARLYNLDGYLARYDGNGDLVWWRRAGVGSGLAQGRRVAVDSAGGVYWAGEYQGPGPLQMDSATGLVDLPPANPRSDVFLVKYGAAGGFVWGETAGDRQTDRVTGLAVDEDDRVWLGGIVQGTVGFGGASPLHLLTDGFQNSYVAQFGTDGSIEQLYQSTRTTFSQSLAPGSAIASGTFGSTALFDPLANVTLTASGSSDLYLAKYTTDAPVADVRLDFAVDQPAPPEGDSLTFTLTLSNDGPSAASNVMVDVRLPVGLQNMVVTPSQGTFTEFGGWNAGTVANGASATLAFSGVAGQSSPIKVAAEIVGVHQADPDLSNNEAATLSDPTLPPGSSLAVTNTLNDGVGSLRNAIEYANSLPTGGGPHAITFDIPAGDPGRDANGVCTIALDYGIAPATGPVIIDGLTQDGADNGSWPPSLKIVIDGDDAPSGASGIYLSGGGSTVRGLVIVGFSYASDSETFERRGGAGVSIDSEGNTVAGNILGTDVTGTMSGSSLENDYGVRIINAPDNVIGGNTVAERNLISNNDETGISIEETGATNNRILGNFIGTNAAGDAALENDGPGIEITDAPGNIIGGDDRDAGVLNRSGNLISGNDDEGILIDGDLAHDQVIQGNFIGTNMAGDAAVPNEDEGIEVDDDSGGHRIGGVTVAGACGKAGNLISGNGYKGIALDDNEGVDPVRIQGNFIGTDSTGLVALPNEDVGIASSDDGVIIGGGDPTLRNVISGNEDEGIDIGRGDFVVQGNHIGVGIDGTTALGNGGPGIRCNGDDGLIGGTAAGEGNVIAHNQEAGVSVSFGLRNRILGNSFFSNSALGIDLQNDGITGNDIGDGDGEAANNLQNYPLLDTLPTLTGAGSTTVNATLNSTPSTEFRIEFFASEVTDGSKFGEGQVFLGAQQAVTNVAGNATISATFTNPAGVPTGWFVTLTATGPDGTSEFSQGADFPFGGSVVSSADQGEGSFREALAYASVTTGRDVITFDIPPTDSGYNAATGVVTITLGSDLPAINHPVIIDGLSQPGASGAQWPPDLKIRFNGAATSTFGGFRLQAEGSEVRGLVLNGFQNAIYTEGSDCVIQTNFIGTDPSGTSAAPNGTGIVANSAAYLIGGAEDRHRNLISGNTDWGIRAGAGGGLILNNFIGTDVTGTVALGNGGPGIGTGSRTVIRANVISANGFLKNPANPFFIGADTTSDCGIHVRQNDNIVQANLIGTDASGSQPLGNKGSGVEIQGGKGNLVGGTAPHEGNLIAHNGDDGIEVHPRYANTTAERNRLLGNSVYLNAALGIDLDNNGVTPNDAGDLDVFSNFRQNFPVIDSAVSASSGTRVVGDLESVAGLEYRLEFFVNDTSDANNHGEGKAYLGSTTVTTDGAGSASFDVVFPGVAGGKWITATATDPDGNTSEFSARVAATGTALLNYNDWAAYHSLPAGSFGIDSDSDSIVNGIEFGLGGDPRDGGSIPGLAVPDDLAEGWLAGFRKPPGLAGLVYGYETSTDLSGWSNQGFRVVEDSPANLKVLLPVADRRFGRVMVSEEP